MKQVVSNFWTGNFFFQISRIDSTRSPVLYFIKNLLGVEQKKSFYEQELHPAPTPGYIYNKLEQKWEREKNRKRNKWKFWAAEFAAIHVKWRFNLFCRNRLSIWSKGTKNDNFFLLYLRLWQFRRANLSDEIMKKT